MNGIQAKKCESVYFPMTYRFNKIERKLIYPFYESQSMDVHRWIVRNKASHLYSPLYFNCMFLIAHLFESFFSVLFFFTSISPLTSKIHCGKKLSISEVLSILLYEKSPRVWEVEIGFNTACLIIRIQLLFLTSHYFIKSGRHQQWGNKIHIQNGSPQNCW